MIQDWSELVLAAFKTCHRYLRPVEPRTVEDNAAQDAARWVRLG